MAMRWLRLYSEFATDPKIQIMSEKMQRRYIMLLCLRCTDELNKLDREELALALRISPKELEKTIQLFLDKNLLTEDMEIPNWEIRQYTSDCSTERVKKYRDKKKENGNETFQKRYGNGSETPPDTDTETDTETETTPPKVPQGGERDELESVVEEIRNAYPKTDGGVSDTRESIRKAIRGNLVRGKGKVRDPVDPQFLLEVTREFAASPFVASRRGTDEWRYVPYATRFFNNNLWETDRYKWQEAYRPRGQPNGSTPREDLFTEAERAKLSNYSTWGGNGNG